MHVILFETDVNELSQLITHKEIELPLIPIDTILRHERSVGNSSSHLIPQHIELYIRLVEQVQTQELYLPLLTG